MLKIKTLPGNIRNNEKTVLDCSNYPENDPSKWAVFAWLLERSVISDTLELCGRDGLTTVLNNETVKEQSRFVNMMTLQERCSLRLQMLNHYL